MRIEIDLRDDKADFVLDLLRNLKCVAVKTINGLTEKQRIIEGIRVGMEEVKLHREGKIKLLSAKELLNEL